MEATDKELQTAEQLGELLCTTHEIAVFLERDERQLEAELKAGTSALAKAVLRGRFRTVLAVRRSEIDMAINGSSPAQNLVDDLMKRLR